MVLSVLSWSCETGRYCVSLLLLEWFFPLLACQNPTGADQGVLTFRNRSYSFHQKSDLDGYAFALIIG